MEAGAFKAIEVADGIYWVGAIDFAVRSFHGYLTSRGTTYNAYLIMGEQITLVDGVRQPFLAEMLGRIASVVSPEQITHVVSNHAELDHSGALPELIRLIKPQTVLASDQGAKALQEHFHWDQPVRTVAHGERFELGGGRSVRFFEARMVHWPDSMFSWLEGEGVLFTNDGFGMHLATSERFVDELDQGICHREAAKYYANILLPFSKRVSQVLADLAKLDLDIRLIAPDHGPIWRRNPTQVIDLYRRWAERPPSAKAVVVYDSMWDSTARMARSIADGLLEGGLNVQVMPLGASHRSDVATELLEAGALLVGSPTLNNQMYPTVADILSYLAGLRPRNLIGAAFGSYGWGGQAVGQIEQALTKIGIELVADGLRVRYVPTGDDLARCRALGITVAAALKERLG